MSDVSLESRTSTSTSMSAPISNFSTVNTPLRLQSWQRRIQSHPDKNFINYILSGIERGFCIGRDSTCHVNSATKNKQSAHDNPTAIEKYLQDQIQQGNIFGPFLPHETPNVHINSFGVIPKKHQPGKWRVITDLSYPKGSSVNDAINPKLCSLKYITVEQVAKKAFSLGKGSLIAKIDIKAAYRLIPVSPQDRPFLGVKWGGKVYVDGMLPFGLRSAPKIFNAVADAVEWCVANENVPAIYHYLDDFAVIGPPNSEECENSLQKLKLVCEDLGIPLVSEKQAGPSTNIKFLGIIIDTIQQELQLPEDKHKRLLDAAKQWEEYHYCNKKDLESFIGTLRHACAVIQPAGYSFLKSFISLQKMVKQKDDHTVCLDANFRSNVTWWRVFASYWNGHALLPGISNKHVEFTSDGSGGWGCGALYGTRWFQLQWDDTTRFYFNTIIELVPIVIAAVIWGPEWKGSTVVIKCKNKSMVKLLNDRYSEEPIVMHMLRSLFFIEAWLQFKLIPQYTPSSLAVHLSNNRLSQFYSQLPGAYRLSCFIPPSVLYWLLDPNMNWTSPRWIKKFDTFVNRVLTASSTQQTPANSA